MVVVLSWGRGRVKVKKSRVGRGQSVTEPLEALLGERPDRRRGCFVDWAVSSRAHLRLLAVAALARARLTLITSHQTDDVIKQDNNVDVSRSRRAAE